MKKIEAFSQLFLILFSASLLFIPLSPSIEYSQFLGGQGESVLLPYWRIQEQELDNAFRIDILTITVTFDYVPEEYYADCRAVIEFRMRPGQQRPVIHLDPAIRYNAVNSVLLNSEPLNFSNESDVRVLTYDESSQQALEFQRDLDANTVHTLEISYVLPLPEGYPRFSSEVNDLEGRGNEEVFPTLNTPHELARHILTFRVHSSRAFRCIGSGLVVENHSPLVTNSSNVQQWTLDTEQEVASYSVMFALLPAEDTIFEERDIAGVNVRILAFVGGASIHSAFNTLQQWLPELISNLGPFPMTRGLSIFLVQFGGGMEYYGATITSLWALRHEVFHMYYGCSTINKTYRDSWMDEAINEWYELSAGPNFAPIPNNYRSNIVSGRSAVAVGFDRRAYNEGARIIEAMAQELGGRDQMIAFLRHVHSNYSFDPFTTLEFLDYLDVYSGVDMRDPFLDWLYTGEDATAAASSSSCGFMREADMTPPQPILQKHSISKGGTR